MFTEVRTLLGGGLAGFLTAALIASGILEGTELRALDTLFELRGERPPTAPIVIVAVHEDSFDELNLSWPFPRALHAELLDRLRAAPPIAIGIDMIFSEPSLFGPADDEALAQGVMRAGNVVLAAASTRETFVGGEKQDTNLPLPQIRRGAAAVGPVNLHTDADGNVRRAAIRHRFDDETLLSFDAHLHRLAVAAGLPGRPLTRQPDILVNYLGPPRTFEWIPYYQVLRGEVAPETFRGKIVLVGATSPVLQDVFSTPFAGARAMPGVEIHANVLETLLRGNALREAPWLLSPALALLTALGGAVLVAKLRALRAFSAFVAALATLAVVTGLLFVLGDIWMRSVGLALGLVLGYGLPATDHFIREQREKRRLSQFFSPAVLREIVRHREGATLGSSRRLVTVLFSDIRGFTSISERLEPEQVAEMLGEYLSEMTEVVFKHGGTVDKYIGDCVMALYNVPFEDPHHAVNAVRTALEFQEITRAVSAKWEARLGVELKNGVGINTGEAVCGTMGSRQRREYTAIGDTVNLASRLEGATKEQGTSVIISESTFEYVHGQFRTRELGAITVKGKSRPVRIYAVLADDARRHPRVVVDAPVTVVARDDGRTWTVRTRDVSAGGLVVVGLPPDLTPGVRIGVSSDAEALPEPIKSEGTIVWRRDTLAGIAYSSVASDSP
jgi:adenylate cyclase